MLRKAGHTALHVRDVGLREADDLTIFEHAGSDDLIVVAPDTDFGTLLAAREVAKPSAGSKYRRGLPVRGAGLAAWPARTVQAQRTAADRVRRSGHPEVDLLFPDARVAIELDGPQHLLDPVAYRRDRRKDRLLQEQGYFVLRYVAEDIARDLDSVLDSILRIVAARTRRE